MKGISFSYIGLGLLFLWGGLEKFFEGFLGGVGLDGVVGMLSDGPLAGLGDTGLLVLAVIIAAVELLAGLVFLGAAFGCGGCGKYKKWAGWVVVIIMVGALGLAHVPALLKNPDKAMMWAGALLHLAILGVGLDAATKCCGGKK